MPRCFQSIQSTENTMKQTVNFRLPVYSSLNAGAIIAAGEPLKLILNDRSQTEVYVTDVADNGRVVSWNLIDQRVIPAVTSSQNATTAASDDSTGDALANAIKASYNAAQVDVAAFYAAYAALGSPTSSQNATTAASSDVTRLALANALKVSMNNLIADIAEVFENHPELGVPTSAAVTTANGSDDATTNTLLNALKTAYNKVQVDVAGAFTKLDSGAFSPREFDVRGVDGAHQIAPPAGDLDFDMMPSHRDTGPISPAVNGN